jgi:hypothetical protein
MALSVVPRPQPIKHNGIVIISIILIPLLTVLIPLLTVLIPLLTVLIPLLTVLEEASHPTSSSQLSIECGGYVRQIGVTLTLYGTFCLRYRHLCLTIPRDCQRNIFSY